MSPTETAAEDIRNALQLLGEVAIVPGGRHSDECLAAAKARLEAALSKLEAPRFARITQQDMGGAVTLRAAGDRIVRVERNYIVREDSADEERRRAASEPPLDYERPGQVDPVLRGQPIEDPNYSGE